MLPTKNRLKKEDFSTILKKGRFLHGQNLYIKYLKSENIDDISRFSIVVPAKVQKTSVGRHLVKRRVSAAVEKLLKSSKPQYLCAFFVKTKEENGKILGQETEELLKKAGILN